MPCASPFPNPFPNPCPPQFPVAGVAEIVEPIANWATCMMMPYIHHYCHVACIASFLMGRGYDANTALAMAQDMVRQMGPMAGFPGMSPGMSPGFPGMSPGMSPGFPGMTSGTPGVPGIPG
jgi:hypothetical protein